MVAVDSDIGICNHYVKCLISNLMARGEITQDLLFNLFNLFVLLNLSKGCKAVADDVFIKYIERRQDNYPLRSSRSRCRSRRFVAGSTPPYSSTARRSGQVTAKGGPAKKKNNRSYNPDWMFEAPITGQRAYPLTT
jgi:hypothetical protein